jgi:hypothetical protein
VPNELKASKKASFNSSKDVDSGLHLFSWYVLGGLADFAETYARESLRKFFLSRILPYGK